jgi:hypothetical protein
MIWEPVDRGKDFFFWSSHVQRDRNHDVFFSQTCAPHTFVDALYLSIVHSTDVVNRKRKVQLLVQMAVRKQKLQEHKPIKLLKGELSALELETYLLCGIYLRV